MNTIPDVPGKYCVTLTVRELLRSIASAVLKLELLLAPTPDLQMAVGTWLYILGEELCGGKPSRSNFALVPIATENDTTSHDC